MFTRQVFFSPKELRKLRSEEHDDAWIHILK